MYDFPIFITGIHMFFCALMTFPFVKVRLTMAEQVRLVSPLALLFAISVGMGNLSLVYVYPSFSQMVSTATPLITMVLHVCLTRARYNRWALVSVPILSGGFLLCYQHERNYHIVGLLCSLLAAVFRGAKSLLQVSTYKKGVSPTFLSFCSRSWSLREVEAQNDTHDVASLNYTRISAQR